MPDSASRENSIRSRRLPDHSPVAKGLVAILRGRPHIYVLYLGLLAAILIDVLVLKFLA
jgi:hypothetical protein